MKALIVLAHPNIETSRVNKRWREELAQHTDIAEIHELYREYPDWQIDVEREQRLLESHELIVLQFPLYWYSYPPLLKKWLGIWINGAQTSRQKIRHRRIHRRQGGKLHTDRQHRLYRG